MQAIIEFIDSAEDEPEVLASNSLEDVDIVPVVGEWLEIRTFPNSGWKQRESVNVLDVTPFLHLKGYLIRVQWPSFEDDPTGVHLEERRFRHLLTLHGWTVHAKRRPLPEGFDLDDFDPQEQKTLRKF